MKPFEAPQRIVKIKTAIYIVSIIYKFFIRSMVFIIINGIYIYIYFIRLHLDYPGLVFDEPNMSRVLEI